MANPFTAEVAAAVRARRADLRLSQQDLADMAGVSERFVRFVEQGKPTLRLDTLFSPAGHAWAPAAAHHPHQRGRPRPGDPTAVGHPAVGRPAGR